MQETINTQQATEGEAPDFAALLTAQAHVDGAARQVAELADGSQPRTVARHMYWTVAQMVAHHSSNGCNLNPGDLFGSGPEMVPEPKRSPGLRLQPLEL